MHRTAAAAVLLSVAAASLVATTSLDAQAKRRSAPKKSAVADTSVAPRSVSEPAAAPVAAPVAVSTPISRPSGSVAPRPLPPVTNPAWMRDTPWLGFALGSGTGTLSCPVCRSTPSNAVVARLAATIPWRERLSVGVQGQSWLNVFGTTANQTLVAFEGIARWRPFARQPLGITGGLGVASYRLDDGAFVLRATAPVLEAVVTWELPLRGAVAITPYFALMTTAPARLRANNGFALADNARIGLAQVGLGLSWF